MNVRLLGIGPKVGEAAPSIVAAVRIPPEDLQETIGNHLMQKP